jgi:uncharacterized protein YcaQ
MRRLVQVAARALGVATEVELRDYFRMSAVATKRAVAELVEAGELRPVTVQGWRLRAYLHRDARLPRRVHAATVVSPFDPLVWERTRSERLFNFRYRIGIYTKADRREDGYYVLPFLFGDQIVARVDLKADRKAGILKVPGAWLEPGHSAAEVAEPLADALTEVASWLGLADVGPVEKGDLARATGRVTV